MNKHLTTSLLSLFLCIAGPAFAVDTGAVLGGAIGGGVGAAVGTEVGGPEGAIIGGAVGGGVGAAIGANDDRHKNEKTVIYVEQPRQDEPPGHAYGHRIPPGHAKHKHKHKYH
jgi:phage tail tape-measure protein